MNSIDTQSSFISAALESAIQNTELDYKFNSDEELSQILNFGLDHKIESVLAKSIPILSEVNSLNEVVYKRQIEWIDNNKSSLQQIPSFTMIQGFPRNSNFSPFMSAGRRCDIDFCIANEDSSLTDSIFSSLGLEQAAWVDDQRIILSADQIEDIEKAIDYAYSKQLPYTKLIPVELPVLESFEIDDVFGALRKHNDTISILITLERTYSFERNDAKIYLRDENRVLNNGLYESDDHLFALTAALRLVKGTYNNEYRFRAALEYIHTLAYPKFEMKSGSLIKLANELNISQSLAEANGFISNYSKNAKNLITNLNLPINADTELVNFYNSNVSGADSNK